ncbi:MAG TPA: type II toxin-antitoxin system death-on-curing family toxin [Pyrinomonadaceae bacterium]|nr:type II toxin-antitoxin system death-on-curing family toxin [Pyrinomonadaceae bacterium]
MAIDEYVYLTVAEAVKFHVLYMRKAGETRFGVFDKTLVESALTRPQHAAIYENADLFRQAATLLLGLIKNHPWEGGNKRTATFLTQLFLKRNGYKIIAQTSEIIELCLKIESDVWKVDEIESWLRSKIKVL